MLQKLFKNYLYPIAMLSGSIIGVGFLSLPYIALKVGALPMAFYFVVLTAVVLTIHIIFAEVSLKTPDFKRWPGFVGFYFGPFARAILLIPTVVGSFGVMLAYLIVGGQFLAATFSPFVGGSLFFYTLIYFFILSLILSSEIRQISKLQLCAVCLLIASLFFIFVKGFAHIQLSNFFIENPQLKFLDLFLPYGAILFSLWGTGLIPEAEEMLDTPKKSLKKIVFIGTLIPAAIYIFFTFLVLAISGNQTTESALVGVRHVLGEGLASGILFIGVVTTFTAFISQGFYLKKVLMYDLKIKKFPAWVFTCFPPLVLFLLGFNSFIPLISFVGGVLLGIDGILILIMYRKVGGKKVIIYPLAMVFILGIIYSIVYSFT